VAPTSDPPRDDRPSEISDGSERRSADRIDVSWSVDCVTEETFLYAAISNISEVGIFVRTTDPLPVGTRMLLHFSPPGMRTFSLAGQVQWINPVRALGENLNPGMGIRFLELTPDDREQIVEAIHTVAYVRTTAS
jgi:type IV pilus assembly protein PilZ